MTCANCGAPLPDGARFCPNCGTPVSGMLETSERRIVTVLFADLVDSTGLARRLDAERAREVLGAFYDAAVDEIVSLRGQPEKFIGDAVMAVFGLPQVHEDDAVRAIRAGQAICDRVERLGRSLGLPTPLRVRVGIEAGDVATGVGPAGQLLVTGATVNVAARLQTKAEPGEVLVGETARALTWMAVEFGERREIPAKGFDEALSGYPVVSLTTKSSRRTIPLVGRRAELSVLRETLARSVATRRPHLFTLVGEPGIGKSRLLQELIAGLDESVTALVGRVQAYDWGETFAPVSEMLRDLAGIDENDPLEKRRRSLQDVVAACCHPSEVARVSSRLELALDLEAEDRDESTYVQEVQSGFLALIEGLTQKGPVALVFDDVHESGAALLDLIERLAATSRHGPGPLFVVAAGRAEILEFRPSWGSTAVNYTLVRLEPLGEDDSVELARQAGGGVLRESTAARIAERAGGNPFFIVETTGMLLHEEETLPMHLGAPLPPTVQAVVAARLGHLTPQLRDVARRVSTFLYSFDLAELAVVAPAGTEEDLRALEDEEILVHEERVDRSGRDGGARVRWRFRHETLRDVAYASLPKRERLRLHLAIAGYLESESRRTAWAADHLERAALASLDLNPADRTIPERAADALAEAGDLARRRMEGKAAVEFYERALAMAGPADGWGVREARVLAGLGESRYWLAEYRAASDSLARAEELAEATGDDWALSLALRFRGDIALNIDGDIDRAQALLDRALAAAERLEERRPLIRTLLFAGWVPWAREDYTAAEELWTRALAMAREARDRWAETRALTSLASLRLETGDRDEAMKLVREGLEVASDLGDQFSVAVASAGLGRIHRYRDEPEEALPYLDRAVAIFSELGARWELADTLGERGDTYRRLGRLEEAEADLGTSLRLSEELGERQLASWTWRQLAKVALRRGDRAAADERNRRADEEELRRPR